MKIEEYDKLQKHENSFQIAIDFDGVIHGNSKGFYDGTIYDSPIEGSIDAIKWFNSRGYDIVLFTAKAKPDRPLVKNKTCSVKDARKIFNFFFYEKGDYIKTKVQDFSK